MKSEEWESNEFEINKESDAELWKNAGKILFGDAWVSGKAIYPSDNGNGVVCGWVTKDGFKVILAARPSRHTWYCDLMDFLGSV